MAAMLMSVSKKSGQTIALLWFVQVFLKQTLHCNSGKAMVAMLRPLFYSLYDTEAEVWWQYSTGAAAMLWLFCDIAPMLVAMLLW